MTTSVTKPQSIIPILIRKTPNMTFLHDKQKKNK